MSELKYGIVIPCYKSAGYLKKCLTSIIEQKYKEKTILCVLDGPDTETEKIIKEFKDVSYNILEKQGGAPKARNKGAEMLEDKVDIILFWDADCYMEAGALNDWSNVLTKNPDIDFVYSDYRFTITELGAINGEEFNHFLLKCNNYISTMSPIRAKLKPRFDETLESLQDWDFFLTLAEKGHKGKYLAGIRFVTQPPTEDSISGKGCKPGTLLERKNIVKEKHGIEKKPICFTSLVSSERALGIAQALDNADFSRNPGFTAHDYKMVYLMGFYAQDAMNHAAVFKNGDKDVRKVIHWMGSDVDALYQLVPMGMGLNLGRILGKEYINFCETARMKTMLAKIGINAEILKLPITLDGLPTEKPKEFKVLIDVDESYKKFIIMLKDAMPDISFTDLTITDMSEYPLLLRLSTSGILDEGCKKFLCSGRKIISNIQEPYAGYVEDGEPNDVLKNLINAIRLEQEVFNKGGDVAAERAKEYYLKILSWDNYKATLDKILDKGLLWNSEPKIEKQEKTENWCVRLLSRVLTANHI